MVNRIAGLMLSFAAIGGAVGTPAPFPTQIALNEANAIAQCENLWCAYAWPISLNTTGTRAFFVNQGGVVLETSMNAVQYFGVGCSPAYTAAFSAAGMNLPVATPPLQGVDGNDWIPIP